MSNNKNNNSDSNSGQNQQSQQPKEKPSRFPRVPSDQRVRIERGDKSEGSIKKQGNCS